MTTLGLKNVNMLTKEQYDTIAEPVKDELYAISGSGFGFPSNRFEDLELGASGTTYTAPANGYFYLQKKTSAASQWVWLLNKTKIYSYCEQVYPSGNYAIGMLQVEKGDIVEITYSAAGATDYFRFIYAEGE
jgi:hypothetical protein